MLPQVRPLGDLEEDEPPFAPGELGLELPPAIVPLTRRFEMARMIVEDFRPELTPLRALEMADALGSFLDSCQLEEVEDMARVTLAGSASTSASKARRPSPPRRWKRSNWPACCNLTQAMA